MLKSSCQCHSSCLESSYASVYSFLGPRRPLIQPSISVPSTRPRQNFPEFIDELKHCRQASGTPQIIYFLKAIQIWTKIQIQIQIQRQIQIQIQRQRQIKGEAETPMVWYIYIIARIKRFQLRAQNLDSLTYFWRRHWIGFISLPAY